MQDLYFASFSCPNCGELNQVLFISLVVDYNWLEAAERPPTPVSSMAPKEEEDNKRHLGIKVVNSPPGKSREASFFTILPERNVIINTGPFMYVVPNDSTYELGTNNIQLFFYQCVLENRI